MLFTESDLEDAMDKIETIHFHEEKEVGRNQVQVLQCRTCLGGRYVHAGDCWSQDSPRLRAVQLPEREGGYTGDPHTRRR